MLKNGQTPDACIIPSELLKAASYLGAEWITAIRYLVWTTVALDNVCVIKSFTYFGVDIQNLGSSEHHVSKCVAIVWLPWIVTFGIPPSLFLQNYNCIESSSFLSSSTVQKPGSPLDNL